MGGLIFLFSSLVSTLLWARVLSRYVLLALLVTIAMGAIGLLGHAMVSAKPLRMPIQHALDGMRAPLPFLRTAHDDTS